MSTSTGEQALIKIRLLFLNTERRGERIAIDSERVVIGRSREADLRIPSKTISRLHCVVELDDGDVWVSDLDSRNGTVIDDKPLTPRERYPVYHHDVLTIGKVAFRLSIRDAITGDPIVSADTADFDQSGLADPRDEEPKTSTTGAMLLDELDRLAESLNIPAHDTTFEEPNSDSSETVTRELTTSGNEKKDGRGKQEVTPPADSNASDKEQAETNEYNESQNSADNASVNEEEKGPGKLPEHLKPKGFKSSQSAAESTLKNLFTR